MNIHDDQQVSVKMVKKKQHLSWVITVAVTVWIGFSTSSIAGQCRDEFPMGMKSLIVKIMKSYPDIPGVVVGFYRPDIGYSVFAYGENSIENSDPMRPGLVFDVGSVHKLLKWVLLEKLQEQGMFDFDEPISKYVQLPFQSDARIRTLTNHTLGIVDIGLPVIKDALARMSAGSLPHEYSFNEMMEFLKQESGDGISAGRIENFKIGKQFNYSSYGPVIAGEIAYQTTGKNTRDLIRELVLIPLGLQDTHFIGFAPRPATLVQGYGSAERNDSSDPFGIVPPDLLLAIASAHEGPIYSTACDMLHFVDAISAPDQAFLRADTIGSRIADPIDWGGFADVGRGIFKYHGLYDGEFWVHTGDGIHSHASLVGYNPESHVSIAIMVNLKSRFIENDFGFHFDILDGIYNMSGE